MAGNHGGGPTRRESGSVLTVLVAGAANLAIALAKAVAGVVSNSSAMLSESAHSVADTVTEVLLLVALHRGRHPPDAHHPFGYGKESYVWALLAALLTFVAGGGFSVASGLHTLRTGHPPNEFGASFVVLGIAFVVESISLVRAARQVRSTAAHRRISSLRYLQITPDTAVKAVAMEDAAALVGILLAAAGLGLSRLTGDEVWDALASFAIGLLLFTVAAVLTNANMHLLVGRAIPHGMRESIRRELAALPEIRDVPTLLTMQLGPDEVLVAAKVDFAEEATGSAIEYAADEAERRLQARFPTIRYLFLDPTGSRQPPRQIG